MKERPIIFSGPMVRTILEGRKTQTRRVVKHNWAWGEQFELAHKALHLCPYGQPGDRLWVREHAWIAMPYFADDHPGNIPDDQGRRRMVGYDATMSDDSRQYARDYGVKLTPSIHMPRWASRITIEITDIRVERLQDISEKDAKAEGAKCLDIASGREDIFKVYGYYRDHFRHIWDSVNRAPWKSNPLVWVIQFKPCNLPTVGVWELPEAELAKPTFIFKGKTQNSKSPKHDQRNERR